MAKGNESTTKFKADISELKSAFQQAQRAVKVANSEFKAATAGMDDWGSSADGLSAKINQLNKVLDAEKTKLSNLEKQYALVVKEQGENSKGAQDLLIKINNQKAAVANTEKQIKSYTQKLSDIDSSSKEAASASDELNNTIAEQEDELSALKKKYADAILTQGKHSEEAKNTAKQIDSLSQELQDNKKSLSDVEKAADKVDNSLDDLDESAENLNDGFTVAKGAIAGFISNGLTALAGAAKDALSSIINLADETREYREDMGKLETAFETAGFTSEQATKVYKDFYAVLGEEDRSVEAVNHLAKLTDSQKDLDKWTTICTGVWGTFGDSLPIEGLTEAANETAKVGQVTGPLADALNWAGVSEDKFNESLSKCSDEQERQQLITDTLSGLYSDAAKKYEEVNGSVMDANRATSDFTDAQATLGEKIEPITTTVKQGFADILTKITELVSGADFSSLQEGIKNAFAWLIDTGLPAIKNGFNWIIDNKDLLIAGVTGIATAFLAFKVVTIIQSVTSALKGMTIAQAALNLVMSMNPIGLIISLIAGLVAAFVVLWNKSDSFREFWINIWEDIKERVRVAIEVIKALWDKIKKWFIDLCVSIAERNQEAIDKIKSVWNAITGFFSGIWDNIKSVFSTVKDYFGEKFQAAIDTIKAIFSVIGDFFKDVYKKITDAIKNINTWFSDKFKAAFTAVKDAFSSVGDFFKGIWDKITGVFSNVKSWFSDTFQSAVDAIKNVFGKVGDFFGDLWDTIKSKVTDLATNIGDTIGDTIKSGINGIIGIVESALNKIPDVVNGAIELINKLPGVGIDWRMDDFSLPRLAKGGVINSATTAIIGEDGTEAVVPLEKNTRWLDILASKLANEFDSIGGAGMLQSTPNVVNNFYQTNNSPKALSRLEIYRQSKNLLGLKGV